MTLRDFGALWMIVTAGGLLIGGLAAILKLRDSRRAGSTDPGRRQVLGWRCWRCNRLHRVSAKSCWRCRLSLSLSSWKRAR